MAERSGRRYDMDEDRYGASHRRRDDSRDNDRGKETARRSEKKSSKHHSRRKSESDESEEDRKPKRKSKSDSRALVKSGSKSIEKKKKARQQDSDDDDSDNEVITTKRKRFEEVSYEDLMPGYIEALMDILEIQESKIDKCCHDGLIRLDTVEDCLNADKAVEKHGDGKAAADEWARYEKRYKKEIKEFGGDMRRLGRGGESAEPSGHRAMHIRESPTVIVRDRPVIVEHVTTHRVDSMGPRIPEPYRRDGCRDCGWMGHYCGDPYHRFH